MSGMTLKRAGPECEATRNLVCMRLQLPKEHKCVAIVGCGSMWWWQNLTVQASGSVPALGEDV